MEKGNPSRSREILGVGSQEGLQINTVWFTGYQKRIWKLPPAVGIMVINENRIKTRILLESPPGRRAQVMTCPPPSHRIEKFGILGIEASD